MDIKFNQSQYFRTGLQYGAQDFMLETTRGHLRAMQPLNLYKQRDTKAFHLGYELGYQDKYAKAYKDNKKLLLMAIELQDMQPIGWELYQHIGGCFIEEL